MKIVFIADINSPTARSWIAYFADSGDEVEVISLYPPFLQPLPHVRTHVRPLILSRAMGLSNSAQGVRTIATPRQKRLVQLVLRRGIVGLRLPILWSSVLAPLDTLRLRRSIQALIKEIGPNLVHGLRLPMEGEVLADLQGFPIVLSNWGWDLTNYASNYRVHQYLIRRVLGQAQGLHADCERDIKLASSFGFPSGRPTLLIPGAGGIHKGLRANQAQADAWRQRLRIASGAPVVLNPRGTRSYIRNTEYFNAVPQVLRSHPDAVFISVGVNDDATISHAVNSLGIAHAVRLLPKVSQTDLAALFRLSAVMVSPSLYDGTPNTLLEGMANGAVPLASDIESVREWIVPGENGLLFDPKDSQQIAAAISQALNSPDWRSAAKDRNQQIIHQRADYDSCMAKARAFYQDVMARWCTEPVSSWPERHKPNV